VAIDNLQQAISTFYRTPRWRGRQIAGIQAQNRQNGKKTKRKTIAGPASSYLLTNGHSAG
jgi:hypothetical protein